MKKKNTETSSGINKIKRENGSEIIKNENRAITTNENKMLISTQRWLAENREEFSRHSALFASMPDGCRLTKPNK